MNIPWKNAKKHAKKFIDKLPRNEKLHLITAIEALPYGEDIKPLKGHKGLLRLRVGKYRVVYTVDNGRLVVVVIDVDSRGGIYKNL